MGTNRKYVEQLFNYGSAVRKVIYMTNAIEFVNSSLRKVTKKRSLQVKILSEKLFICGLRNYKKIGKVVLFQIEQWYVTSFLWMIRFNQES